MTQTMSVPKNATHDDANRISPAGFCQLILFAAYAFSYSLYMAELLPGTAYYASMAAFVIFATARLCWLILIKRTRVSLAFGRSACALFVVAGTFMAISIVEEILADGDFTFTSFGAILYIALPALIALCIANTVSLRVADIYMSIFLFRYVLYFLISGEFSLDAILSISWSASTSPFESSFAHDLLVVGTYFVVRKKMLRAGIAMAFTMLALKRASFVLAPLILIFGRKIRDSTPPKRSSVFVLFLVGAASPFLVMATYSAQFSKTFADTFGISFNEFTSGRLSIYRLAVNCTESSNGFGSLNSCLSDIAMRVSGTSWNGLLHNDTLRVYMEVGLIGVLVYVGALAYTASTSRPAFILMMYAFFVLITSRLITHMSFWVVLFTAIALFERFHSAKKIDDTDTPSLPEEGGVSTIDTQRAT